MEVNVKLYYIAYVHSSHDDNPDKQISSLTQIYEAHHANLITASESTCRIL